MEAFVEVTCMESFVECSVEVTFMKTFTKAFVIIRNVLLKVTSIEDFFKVFLKLS